MFVTRNITKALIRLRNIHCRICKLADLSGTELTEAEAAVRRSLCCIKREYRDSPRVLSQIRSLKQLICCIVPDGPVLPALLAPADFTATASGQTDIDLTWTDGLNEVNYVIEVSNTGVGGWSVLTSPTADSTFYTHSGLTASTTRYYRIRAIADGVTNSNSLYATANATTDADIPTNDADADAFFLYAGITNPTEQSAVTTLFQNAKSNGWWLLTHAMYLHVGQTQLSHSTNARNPGTFDLVFSAGGTDWNYTSVGSVPILPGAFIDTQYIPATDALAFDRHQSYYSQTNEQTTVPDMGTSSSPMYIRYTDNVFYSSFDSGSSYTDGANTDSRGWFLGTKTSNTSNAAYINGVLSDVDPTNNPDNRAATSIRINAASGISGSTTKTTSFNSIGRGISGAMAALMYADIQQFQTTLGRQI